MKVTKVEYTVKPEFADENAANIRKVMDSLKAEPIDGLTYLAARKDDGCSFVHVVVLRDPACQEALGMREPFQAFQAALRASEPVSPPQPVEMDLVAAGFDV